MQPPEKASELNEFVFSNGRLIGDFAGLYASVDDPWQQHRELAALEKLAVIELLSRENFLSVLEYGCGLGYFTKQIAAVCGTAHGVDVAPNAVERARSLNPGPNYLCADILNTDVLDASNHDAIVVAEISWYVLDKLPEFKSIMLEELSGAGFLHLLTTYTAGQQLHGRDVFVDLSGIREFWSDVVDVSEWLEVNSSTAPGVTRTLLFGWIK